MSSEASSVSLTGVQNLFATVTRFSLDPPVMDPDPSRHRTVFPFDLPRAERVTLEISDVSGRSVRSLAAGCRQRGRHTVVWDQTDRAGQQVGSGVYYVRMRAGTFSARRQFMVK